MNDNRLIQYISTFQYQPFCFVMLEPMYEASVVIFVVISSWFMFMFMDLCGLSQINNNSNNNDDGNK
jgi:hypothetical protein